MSSKKSQLLVIFLFLVVALLAASYSDAYAARSGRQNSPPVCYPILFTDEGYWGMFCYDVDNNIATANLQTDGVIIKLNQNPSSVEMLVQYEGSVSVVWQVCDSNNQCVGGTFP